MNTEDSEFERIEREQAIRGVPDAIHYTDNNESDDYVSGWNDCRQAMLAKQSAPATYTCGACGVSMRMEQPDHHDPIGTAQDRLIAEQAAQAQPAREWVGLTDEEISAVWSWSMTAEAERTANTQQHAFARAIEAKLKG